MWARPGILLPREIMKVTVKPISRSFVPRRAFGGSVTASGSGNVVSYGQNGDIPVQADYDADGITDIAVWRPSTGDWYILSSQTGGSSGATFGASGDRPAVGDYDGDGKSDLAVFRPSTGVWYFSYSGGGRAVLHGALATTLLPLPISRATGKPI